MNKNLESKISNFFVVLPVYEKVRNSWLLRAIHASNLNMLNLNLFRPDLIRGSLIWFEYADTSHFDVPVDTTVMVILV